MDAASTQAQINRLDAQIQEKRDTIRSLNASIEEAEDALESGNEVKASFEAFVQAQRQKNQRFSVESIIHAFSDMVQDAIDLLSGRDYTVAQQNADDMVRVIKEKISSLESDKEAAERDLNWLKNERNRYAQELKNLEEGAAE